MLRRLLIIIQIGILLISCTGGENIGYDFDHFYYKPRYAKGFEIIGYKDSLSRTIRIKSAWQGADSVAMDLFIARGGEEPPKGFKGFILDSSAKRLAPLSTTHIAMLEMINREKSIVAVSGGSYSNSKYIIENLGETFDNGRIKDIGNIENIDYEVLVKTMPDLVLIYGINSASIAEKKLESLGIPYLYIGEYLEENPLGRSEWLVVMGELTNSIDASIKEFKMIEKNYNSIKSNVRLKKRPLVMLNAPFGDTWYMPHNSSAIARLIYDAGGKYIYNSKHSRSMPISIEKAYLLAEKADYWLDLGQISSISTLKNTYPHFAEIKCVKNKRIYNPDKILNKNGGNDYWERGMIRPDLVLADLKNIFTNTDDSLTFYRQLVQGDF